MSIKTPIVHYFDELVENGLRVIPLWENSKIPMCKGWTTWTQRSNREVLERYPDANIGLLLGDVVDVEGDTEAANNYILDLIKDYPHPSYVSTKSIHHLFINPDPELTILKFKNIEFRGHSHQSVLPPSHHQGIFYEWVNSTFPIPPMPDRLLSFYQSLKKGKKPIWSNYMTIRCGKCQTKSFINKKRFSLELKVFNKFYMNWECTKCRIIDVRHGCRELRKTMRRNDGHNCR